MLVWISHSYYFCAVFIYANRFSKPLNGTELHFIPAKIFKGNATDKSITPLHI